MKALVASLKNSGSFLLKTEVPFWVNILAAVFISWAFSLLSDLGLREETNRLAQLNNTMLLAISNIQNGQAVIKVDKDERGDYTRLSVEVQGGTFTGHGNGWGGDATGDSAKPER